MTPGPEEWLPGRVTPPTEPGLQAGSHCFFLVSVLPEPPGLWQNPPMALFQRGVAPRPAAGNHSHGGGAPASHEAAPALFRLLSDSALYRAAMSASSLPLALLDAGHAELPFVFVNPAFERLCGYAARDTLGRHASLVLAACSEEASLRSLLEPADAGLRIACRVRQRDATERAVLAVFDPVRDNRGRVTHWIVALDDAPTGL